MELFQEAVEVALVLVFFVASPPVAEKGDDEDKDEKDDDAEERIAEFDKQTVHTPHSP